MHHLILRGKQKGNILKKKRGEKDLTFQKSVQAFKDMLHLCLTRAPSEGKEQPCQQSRSGKKSSSEKHPNSQPSRCTLNNATQTQTM